MPPDEGHHQLLGISLITQMLPHQPNSPLPDLRRIIWSLLFLFHGSTLSRKGASGICGTAGSKLFLQ